jgi:hypothetical protein
MNDPSGVISFGISNITRAQIGKIGIVEVF